jgi:hypothetical protein
MALFRPQALMGNPQPFCFFFKGEKRDKNILKLHVHFWNFLREQQKKMRERFFCCHMFFKKETYSFLIVCFKTKN